MSMKGQNIFAGRQILVLGAGYVGAAVVARCLREGAQVTALTRNPQTCSELATLGAHCVQADLAGEVWHALVEAADYVLVCVGSGGGGVESYRRSYVGGLASVRRWLAGHRVDTLVYTSSTSVYPQGGGALVTEDSPVASGSEDSAGILAEAERSILAPTEGLRRAFVLRLAGIYGPGRHGFLDRMREGGGPLPGEASGHLNLIHRDDIVSAVLACWAAPAEVGTRVFNLADEGRATRGEIAAWLAARIGAPDTGFSGQAAAGRRRLTPDRIVSAEAIRDVLGWRPAFPSFREGYEALLRGEVSPH